MTESSFKMCLFLSFVVFLNRYKVEDGNQVNRRSYASLDAAVTKADCNEEEGEEEMPNPLEDSGSEVSSGVSHK